MMSEKADATRRAAAMYAKGYRIRVTLGHMVDDRFRADSILLPLYVKNSMWVGAMMRLYYKNHVCETVFIMADGTTRARNLQDIG